VSPSPGDKNSTSDDLRILLGIWEKRSVPDIGDRAYHVLVDLIKALDYPYFAVAALSKPPSASLEVLEYALRTFEDKAVCHLIYFELVQANGGVPTASALEWCVASNVNEASYDGAISAYEEILGAILPSYAPPIPTATTFRLLASAAVAKGNFSTAETAYKDCVLQHPQEVRLPFMKDRAMWLVKEHVVGLSEGNPAVRKTSPLARLDSHLAHAEDVLITEAQGSDLASQAEEDTVLVTNMNGLQTLYNVIITALLPVDWNRAARIYGRMVEQDMTPSRSVHEAMRDRGNQHLGIIRRV
jgi:hypothetical protein